MRLLRSILLMMAASLAVVAVAALVAFGCAPGAPTGSVGGGQTGAGGAGGPAQAGSAGSTGFPGDGLSTGAPSGGTWVPGMPISPRDAIDRAESAREQAEVKQIETVCHVYLAEQGLPGEIVKVLSYEFENGRATARATSESGGYAVTMYLERVPGGQWEVRSHTGP